MSIIYTRFVLFRSIQAFTLFTVVAHIFDYEPSSINIFVERLFKFGRNFVNANTIGSKGDTGYRPNCYETQTAAGTE